MDKDFKEFEDRILHSPDIQREWNERQRKFIADSKRANSPLFHVSSSDQAGILNDMRTLFILEKYHKWSDAE